MSVYQKGCYVEFEKNEGTEGKLRSCLSNKLPV